MTGHKITVQFTKNTLAKWQNYIGRGYAMRVSYDAVVTSDATTQVDNEFYMSTLPDKKKYAHSVLASLTFTKIDASGKPLAGARFKIESSNRNQLVLPSGYANANTNRDASCDPDEAISKADGTVTFDGLAQNPDVSYKITEMAAPNGYITLGLSFVVNISNQDAKVVFGDSPTSDPYGLVKPTSPDTDVSNELTVENVHSIAQLPFTGGAGIAFMVVIAALLGTAGASWSCVRVETQPCERVTLTIELICELTFKGIVLEPYPGSAQGPWRWRVVRRCLCEWGVFLRCLRIRYVTLGSYSGGHGNIHT